MCTLNHSAKGCKISIPYPHNNSMIGRLLFPPFISEPQESERSNSFLDLEARSWLHYIQMKSSVDL